MKRTLTEWFLQRAQPHDLSSRSGIEEVVARAWQRALGTESVCMDDDLLELGGDCMTAMRIVAEVETTLGVELPLEMVFENRTVAAQAAAIDTLRRTANTAHVD